MNWCRQSTRLAIYLRDGLACVYCTASVEEGVTLTLDHLKAYSRGGENTASNLVTCCSRCNSSRGVRSVAAFARSVAAYTGTETADVIVARVRRTTRRSLPRAEALALIARRGSVAKALAS